MSAGHHVNHRHSDADLRELERLLADPRVKKLLASDYKVDFSHQMPLTGGSSVKWGTFFLDPRLKKAGEKFWKPVLRHEVVEKALRQVFGMSYDRAHRFATLAEHQMVDDWASYKNIMEGIVRRDEHERPKSLPKGYDYGPLRASRGTKSLKGLKFALGGGVRGYDDGGDVVPLDQDLLATPKAGKIVPPADVGQAATRLPGQIASKALDMSGLGDIYNSLRRGDTWTGVAGAAVPLAAGMMAGPEEKAAQVAEEAAAPALKGITAYHGSPFDFDKFDFSKIGTGEARLDPNLPVSERQVGAYGPGGYFAGNEEVAKSYKEMADHTVGGRPYDINNPVHYAAYLANNLGREGAISKIKSTYDLSDPFHQDALGYLQSGRPLPKVESAGHMYQVRINADPEHFLDWDKPLSEQSERVQAALKNVAGLEKYNSMENALAHGTSQVSQSLRAAGIPGIKYLDQGSRAGGEGTHNYVVFDDKMIDIIKKYGMAGLIAGGAAHFSLPAGGPQQQARGGRVRALRYASAFRS